MNSTPLYLLFIVVVDVSLDITKSAAVSNRAHTSSSICISTGFLSLSTIVIWGWMILCCQRWPAYYRMFSSISVFALVTSSSPSQVLTTKNVCKHYQMVGGMLGERGEVGGWKWPLFENCCSNLSVFVCLFCFLESVCASGVGAERGGERES